MALDEQEEHHARRATTKSSLLDIADWEVQRVDVLDQDHVPQILNAIGHNRGTHQFTWFYFDDGACLREGCSVQRERGDCAGLHSTIAHRNPHFSRW
jgi:hypothetical protein